jgi:hypothetical protein
MCYFTKALRINAKTRKDNYSQKEKSKSTQKQETPPSGTENQTKDRQWE